MTVTTITNIPLHSMLNGGANCRALSQRTRIGPARALPTRGATSSEYISGELEVLESQLSSTTAQSMPVNGSSHRKIYLDHCEIHELTSLSTVEYVAQQLIQGYKDGDNVTQAFLDNYDFYIFPFVNPDGMRCFFSLLLLTTHCVRFCLLPDQRAPVA